MARKQQKVHHSCLDGDFIMRARRFFFILSFPTQYEFVCQTVTWEQSIKGADLPLFSDLSINS
jgi:hypothetical protein